MKSYSERAEATRAKIKTYEAQAKSRRKKLIVSVVSLCSCLLIAFNLVMFVPYTTYPAGYIDLESYRGSEYYDLIKELSYIQYGEGSQPVYKNNFQRFFDNLKTGSTGDWKEDVVDASMENTGSSSAPAAPDAGKGDKGGAADNSGASGEHYEETTDNQVAGVTEGDLIKRTNAYIYYLSLKNLNPELRVYPIAGGDTECIAKFSVNAQQGFYYNSNNAEMYLSENGDTVTVVLPTYKSVQVEKDKYYTTTRYYTEVVNIDVSDRSNIKETGRYLVSGTYVSSRLVNGELLLVTNHTISRNVDYSDEEQFIPSTGANGKLECIPAKDIHCPEKPQYSRYTVVCTVNAQTLEETGSEAFLSYSQNVYVSENNIYLTNGYYCYTDFNNYNNYLYEYKTEISRVSYGGELNYEGSFTVDGEVVSRFCMDEKEEVFRVITSPHVSGYVSIGNQDKYISTNGASLYCIDINSYETVGKLENFAPVEDTVQSARFDGDKVYVCTAVVMTDPVFAIDISDYNNITAVDTGTISGYSIALRKFYGDTLLGIGYDSTGWSSRDLKIELYKETGSAVESVAMFTYIDDDYWYNGYHYDYIDVQFSAEYKAYFIDAERGLVGLGLTAYVYGYNYSSETLNRYILLQYDGENLNLIMDLDLKMEEDYYFYNTTRAVYADGAFYVFTQNRLIVTELSHTL